MDVWKVFIMMDHISFALCTEKLNGNIKSWGVGVYWQVRDEYCDDGVGDDYEDSLCSGH